MPSQLHQQQNEYTERHDTHIQEKESIQNLSCDHGWLTKYEIPFEHYLTISIRNIIIITNSLSFTF